MNLEIVRVGFMFVSYWFFSDVDSFLIFNLTGDWVLGILMGERARSVGPTNLGWPIDDGRRRGRVGLGGRKHIRKGKPRQGG